MQFELTGVTSVAHETFFRSERGEVAFENGTVIVRALVSRADAVLFPSEERIAAMGAPVARLAFAARLIGRRGFVADFA